MAVFVSGRARAKWDGLGEIVTAMVARPLWSQGEPWPWVPGAGGDSVQLSRGVSPGAGMVLWEFGLALVGRTEWDAGGEPGRPCGCGLVFAQYGRVWVWFLSLPPSFPPSQRLLFLLLLRLCTFTSPPCTPGRAGPGGTSWEGTRPPQPVKAFGEESEHGEHIVLALKGTESGALGVGSRQHPHQRQSSVRAELTLCPLPPPQANQALAF